MHTHTPPAAHPPSLPPRRVCTAASLAALLLCAAAHAQTFTPPPNANIVNVTSFGAVANDGLDDLAAFQAALQATVNTSRILFVPDGIYDFSDRLNWGNIGSGGFFTMQGQSQAGTILRLRPSAPGFQFNFDDADDDTIADDAKPFIDAYDGNTANQFRNYLRDLTIEVGPGNPGAIGLEFQSNNTGRIESVTIRSADPLRAGATGLNQGFNFPGPLLIRNLTIEGFDTGYVGAPQEYSAVFEHLTLRNQRVLGIYVWRLPLQIRNLISVNSVPVLRNDSNPGAAGHVVIDGGTFTGGAPSESAIINENSGGVVILRNITTSGYANAVSDRSFSVASPTLVPGGTVAQFTTDAHASLNPSPAAILPIPVEETPSAPAIPVAQWVSVRSFGAIEDDNLDDTTAIQAAMNAGAPVVYFPSGRYTISRTMRVGPSVQRIEGLMSDLVTNAPLATEGGPVFLVPPGSQAIVHFSGLNTAFSGPGASTAHLIDQATANTVVVRDGDISYRNSVRGGKLFLENVVGSDMVFAGQRVWARQLNPEGSGPPLIINDGGDLYVLGLKTEGAATVLKNIRRARATIMGGLVYPSTAIADRSLPMFENDESSLSLSMPESAYVDPNNAYAIWVRETRNGSTANFTRAMLPLGRIHSALGGQIALYNGYQPDASPPSVPGLPALLSVSESSLQLTWSPSTDAQTGVARYDVFRNGAFYRSVPTNTLIDTDLADGTTYTYRVAAVNGAGAVSSQGPALSAATLADTTAPRLVDVGVGLDPRVLVLRFSEPLAPSSASSPASYSIQGPAGVAIAIAALSADGRSVTLRTAPQTPLAPGAYSLALTDITDRASTPNAIAPGTRTGFVFGGAPQGTGLTGQYFNNMIFSGTPALTRIDPQINFSYGFGSPDPLVNADAFAVRWTGRIQPRFSEVYTFFARSDDGSRLFIDGQPIIANWFDQAPTERSGTIALDASRTYEITFEYYENAFAGEVQLSWQSASQPKQIVPQASLFPESRMVTVRTFQGAGADIDLNRFSPGPGTGDSMGAFHSPAQGGFHQAAYWRLDLSSLDLSNNFISEAVGALSQTFFGIGDGKREINIFGVRQSANGDNWLESGPGFVTWQTAIGNDNSGGLANPATSQFLSTYLLDNTGFANNNQSDRLTFGGQRLLDFLAQDTDGRVTFLAKRVDASNEGQSWFTKEWNQPTLAPALKLTLTRRCPQVLVQPVAPSDTAAGQSVALVARVSGAPTLVLRWERDGVPLEDGVTQAGSIVTGSDSNALSIANVQPGDGGVYRLTVTNACGVATSEPATVVVVGCDALDFNGDGLFPDDADLLDFLAVLAGGTCSTGTCSDIDFNNDGLFPDDSDLIAFLRVLAGGPC